MNLHTKNRILKSLLTVLLILTSGFLAVGAGFMGGQWINQQGLIGTDGDSKPNNGLVDLGFINSGKLPVPAYKPEKKVSSPAMPPGQRSTYFNRGFNISSRGYSGWFGKLIDLKSYYQIIRYQMSKEPGKYQGTAGLEITGQFLEDRVTHLHKGLDINVPIGTLVKAVLPGKFYKGDQGDTGFGRYVYIVHTNGLVSYYGHLRDWASLADGTEVEAGQIIGQSGNGGKSTGPHLHFEVRKDNQAVNPLDFLN